MRVTTESSVVLGDFFLFGSGAVLTVRCFLIVAGDSVYIERSDEDYILILVNSIIFHLGPLFFKIF